MPYTADNIEITIASGTAVIATDYGTSGASGFSAAHAQISKVAWGDVDNTYRTTESTPFPVKIYGATGTTIPVTGTVSGTGDFYVRTNATAPLIVKGSTFTTDAPVAITGGIFGVSGGYPVGVTGYVNVSNALSVYGISGATAIAVTGGRRLNSTTDSVTVVGNVGLSGGLALAAATNSVSVFGPGGTTWIHANLYSGNTAVGISGDALKVAVTNTGFTFSVSVAATVGVTNDSVNNALRVQGLSGGTPVTIRGSLAGGAVEIGAYSAVPVGISGTVSIDDTDLIDEIESLKTDIGTVATNAGYALDILNLINSSGNGAKVNVTSITRPSRATHGQKSLTTTASSISTESLRTGVTLKSLATNSVDIYIGSSLSVSQTTGYVLSPGETIYLEISSLGSLFARTASGTATLAYIGT
jgi:hypothetical protein